MFSYWMVIEVGRGGKGVEGLMRFGRGDACLFVESDELEPLNFGLCEVFHLVGLHSGGEEFPN